MNIEKLITAKKRCHQTVLGLHKRANSGHIGSSLSCLDILIYLFTEKRTGMDQVVLSKGHAAAALYTVLAESGLISHSMLDSYYTDGTLLAAHPPCSPGKLAGITFGTGSLGHGLSLAAGLALSAKFTNKKMQVYCVLSDGDCNEGSTWEAALFAAHHKLSNLTVIIDNNNLQGMGRTEDIIDMVSLEDKWKSFAFDVVESSNGNDFVSLDASFESLEAITSDKPKCIIAKTVKGSGVSFMKNKFEWHYLPMSDEQYELALAEIELNNA